MKLPLFLDYRKSIQNKIFLSFILVLLLPSITISISTYFISLNIVEDKVSASFSQTVLYVRNTLEQELEQVQQITDYIFVDNDIKEAFLMKGKSRYQTTVDTDRAERIFKNYTIAKVFHNVNVLKIYGLYGNNLAFGSEDSLRKLDDQRISKSPGYQEAIAGSGKTYWAGYGQKIWKAQFEETPEYEVSLFRTIKDTDYSSDVGVIYLSLQPQIFTELVNKLGIHNESQIYILDNHNNILNKPQSVKEQKVLTQVLKEMDGKGIEGASVRDKEAMYFYYPVSSFGWKVMGIIPIRDLTRDNKYIFYATFLAFFISFLISCIIWYFVSSGIVGPIKRLTRAMKSIREDNLQVKVKNDTNDEIGVLSSSFNYMIDRVNLLYQEIIQKKISIKDAEYKALQAQINPHFLYNTLNSIRWMAIIHKADNIKRVVDALARLLKNTTSKMDQFITIREEMENVNDYIYIQKLSYKNKFEVEWELDESVLDCMCTKFILQPLLENAIYHGIEPKDYFGTVRIRIMKEDGEIQFTITDDGVGMSQELIEGVLSGEKYKKGRFSSIGIGNVNERLKLTYGEAYGLQIRSVEGQFTEIKMKIPMEEEKRAEVRQCTE